MRADVSRLCLKLTLDFGNGVGKADRGEPVVPESFVFDFGERRGNTDGGRFSAKAVCPTAVTVLGMTIDVSWFTAKALAPTAVTLAEWTLTQACWTGKRLRREIVPSCRG